MSFIPVSRNSVNNTAFQRNTVYNQQVPNPNVSNYNFFNESAITTDNTTFNKYISGNIGYITLFVVIVVYILLCIRYYFNNLPFDPNIYIENAHHAPIRNDNKLTVYESPPEKKYIKSTSSFFDTSFVNLQNIKKSSLIHRIFFPRIIYFDETSDLQISIFIFHDNQTKLLRPDSNFFDFRKSSSIDPFASDSDFEKIEYIEIFFLGAQAIYIPAGFWIIIDEVSKLSEMILYS
jgi:hypothetical protein